MKPTERAMYDFWEDWFAQSEDAKRQHLRTPGKGGYFPPASETPGFKGEPDPKEYFHWRHAEVHPDSDFMGIGPTYTEQVYIQCLTRAKVWLYDHGLDALANSDWDQNHVLRIIHYPPHPTGLVGAAHRDFDLLTVSVEGTAPGLEIAKDCRMCRGAGGLTSAVQCHVCEGSGFLWAPRETGIQVGEMLEIYAGGKRAGILDASPYIQATTHRVCTPPNTDRLKAVFFYLPPNEFELRPGLAAGAYLNAPPGSREDGWVGVLNKAGTYKIGST